MGERDREKEREGEEKESAGRSVPETRDRIRRASGICRSTGSFWDSRVWSRHCCAVFLYSFDIDSC